ncbi:protein pelota [Nematocida displodere]|uniref:Protein pelota n=1 Tax=Nematocida displodere TaxID=1805483 RepID=A0A177EBZ9_9MICR|nr:protein pelota [Nematocida displodere]
MKIYSKHCTKQGAFLDAIPEDADDIYALYRIVEKGDVVKTTTSRSTLASDNKTKIRVTLLLEVEAETTSVDLAAGILFVKGKILSETKYTKVGTFHTLDVPTTQRLSIAKSFVDTSAFMMIEQVTAEPKAETAYLLMRKDSYAVVVSTMYTTKRAGTFLIGKSKSAKEKVINTLLSTIKDAVKLLVVVGEDKETLEALKKHPKFKTKTLSIKKPVTSENTFKGDAETLETISKAPEIIAQMGALKYGKEIIAANEFFAKEESSSKGTCTGQKEALLAAEHFLIKKLVVVDTVIRSHDPEERERVSAILILSKQTNAEVHILSQHTPSGEKIFTRGGVVAILSSPISIEDLA